MVFVPDKPEDVCKPCGGTDTGTNLGGRRPIGAISKRLNRSVATSRLRFSVGGVKVNAPSEIRPSTKSLILKNMMVKVMNKQLKVLTLVLWIAVLMAGPVAAQSSSEIDSYMQKLKHRIDRGERSGQLTSKEAARLNGRYNLIAAARDRAERDGRLSRDDRTRLMDSLTRLDQAIWDNLHDDEASHWRAWDSKSGDWRQKPNWRD